VTGAQGALRVTLKVTCELGGSVDIGWSTYDLLDNVKKPKLIGMGSVPFKSWDDAAHWITSTLPRFRALLPPF
jgi:hypothetical protein